MVLVIKNDGHFRAITQILVLNFLSHVLKFQKNATGRAEQFVATFNWVIDVEMYSSSEILERLLNRKCIRRLSAGHL